jgi:hypothetical protein
VPFQVQLGNDGGVRPVPEPVDDIAAIAVRQEVRIEPGVVRPWLRVWSEADVMGHAGILWLCVEKGSSSQ